VLEDGCAEKRCWNADWVQRRKFRTLDSWLRSRNQHRSIALLIFARSDERDRALVLAPSGIRVNAFVQLRRDRERNREKKRADYS